jgi:hypothetical protein
MLSQSRGVRSRAVRCSSEVDSAEARLRQAPTSPWPLAAPTTRSGTNGAAAPTPEAAAGLRRAQAARAAAGSVCRVCRGRRVVATTDGTRPCAACVGWRAGPDSQPGRRPVRLEDIDLKALVAPPEAPMSAAEEGAQQQRGMSEARRQAIKEGMQRRGPLQSDHKRCAPRPHRSTPLSCDAPPLRADSGSKMAVSSHATQS